MCVSSHCACVALQVSVDIMCTPWKLDILKKIEGWIICCSETSQQTSYVHNPTKIVLIMPLVFFNDISHSQS